MAPTWAVLGLFDILQLRGKQSSRFRIVRCCKIEQENKTGTSKVGAISKAQKTQNTFFSKKT